MYAHDLHKGIWPDLTNLLIMYSRRGAVSIGAGFAKLSGHENVWPTTGSDELYFAAWQPKMSTS